MISIANTGHAYCFLRLQEVAKNFQKLVKAKGHAGKVVFKHHTHVRVDVVTPPSLADLLIQNDGDGHTDCDGDMNVAVCMTVVGSSTFTCMNLCNL